MSDTWIVDALEENAARVEIGGAIFTVPRWLLPEDVREGDIVRVSQTRKASRATLMVERDEAATRAALDRSAEQVRERGTAPDPGGDITL
ncbi:MAG TPA: DUF3006 domain-containing protein [Gemmatimonadaceae bacterium]|nr:DUF3006 domain-containing protein [Gemmatimonadaceae bacterium]